MGGRSNNTNNAWLSLGGIQTMLNRNKSFEGVDLFARFSILVKILKK